MSANISVYSTMFTKPEVYILNLSTSIGFVYLISKKTQYIEFIFNCVCVYYKMEWITYMVQVSCLEKYILRKKLIIYFVDKDLRYLPAYYWINIGMASVVASCTYFFLCFCFFTNVFKVRKQKVQNIVKSCSLFLYITIA